MRIPIQYSLSFLFYNSEKIKEAVFFETASFVYKSMGNQFSKLTILPRMAFTFSLSSFTTASFSNSCP